MLKVGDQVPDFAFSSEMFGAVSADSQRGKRYVIYFYPKDDTPGCTREACAFRDNLPRFSGLGIKVFGVSADDEKSHLRFARKHSLNFKLIPDPDHVICEAFGTWVEKSMYGRNYMGVARNTYVIGPDGKVEKIWEKVAPDGHAEEVFAWLNGDPIPVPVKPTPAAKPAAAAKSAVSAKPVSAASQPVAKPVSAPAPKPVPVAAAKVVKPTKTASLKPVSISAKPAASTKKAATAKPAAKKPATKKPVKAKPAAKKAPAKKPAKANAKKATNKPATKKPAAPKKPAVKKAAPKKTSVKKPIAKKSVGKPKRR